MGGLEEIMEGLVATLVALREIMEDMGVKEDSGEVREMQEEIQGMEEVKEVLTVVVEIKDPLQYCSKEAPVQAVEEQVAVEMESVVVGELQDVAQLHAEEALVIMGPEVEVMEAVDVEEDVGERKEMRLISS